MQRFNVLIRFYFQLVKSVIFIIKLNSFCYVAGFVTTSRIVSRLHEIPLSTQLHKL